MATETLRPSAPGDLTEFTPYPGTGEANWEDVDDIVSDDDATYVRVSPPLEQGTQLQICIKENSVTTKTANQSLTESYVLFSQQWDTRPSDSGAWTWNDIDSLQIGVYESLTRFFTDLYNLPSHAGAGTINYVKVYARARWRVSAGTAYLYVTQVYVEVDYTASQNYERTLSTAVGMAATLSRLKGNVRSLSATMKMATSLSRAMAYARSLLTNARMQPSVVGVLGGNSYLCVASRDGLSIKTNTSGGTVWTVCAKDAAGRGTLPASFFTQFDNRLCGLNYQNSGFNYSQVNDLVADWVDKPNFPNLSEKFTGLFVGKDASDTPALYFLTPKGMYYLDVFTNFVFGPTEVTWEYDDTAGKKGLYWKGDNYVAVGKGIYKIHGAEVSLVGPDMDDGLPEGLQGTITDMIGVGFWLVIAINGGSTAKSSILKRYINGKHWHPVYVGSKNDPITSLCWDSGTLYFGEGTDVKSLSLPAITDNINTVSSLERIATGSLTYPYFHSLFEAMPKVGHKVWATTRNCNANETISIYYRIDEDTDWTLLGSFITSPRPTALSFGAAGIEFERIQLKAVFARGGTLTNSPKLESLILEYRVVPPVLWGWTVKVNAVTSGDRRGQDIIEALKAAISSKTLLSFYPGGDKDGTEYFVQVSGMPGVEKGTEFGQEGIYQVNLMEVIE